MLLQRASQQRSMSCPDCQKRGSRKALWIALVAVIAVGAVAAAELSGGERAAKPKSAETQRHG